MVFEFMILALLALRSTDWTNGSLVLIIKGLVSHLVDKFMQVPAIAAEPKNDFDCVLSFSFNKIYRFVQF